VIGIVASRLADRYHRPVVLIAGADGDWKGSGRSIPAFDLHGALAACSGHLERFGGHRAAAGLSIGPDRVEAFAEAFGAHADAVLSDDDLRQVTVIDAVVPGNALTLALCEELARLAPFGLGNPGVTLLTAGCELTDLTAVGDGRHLRFRVVEAGRPAGSAIAFGLGSQQDRYRRELPYDVAFRLEANHWQGTVTPQLVVRRIFETPERYRELRDWLADEWRKDETSRDVDARAIFAELGLAGPGAGRRSLYESNRFRALLVQPEPLTRAA
jgi:single-stranded-DNA-specific exonuclease